MSSDPAEADFVALQPKQPPEPTPYHTYPTYPGTYQHSSGGLAAPTVSSGSNKEEEKGEKDPEEEYEPGSIPVEHLNVSSRVFVGSWGHTSLAGQTRYPTPRKGLVQYLTCNTPQIIGGVKYKSLTTVRYHP